jgi:MFS family permease
MSYCPKCGKEIDDETAFCPKCGAGVSSSAGEVNNRSNSPNNGPYYNRPDLGSKLKAISICGIIWGILSIIFGILYFILFVLLGAFVSIATLGVGTGIGAFLMLYGLIILILSLLSGIFALMSRGKINRLESFNVAFAYCLTGAILAVITGVILIISVLGTYFGILFIIAGVIGIIFAILMRGEKQRFWS